MTLANARYTLKNRYPILEVEVDGQLASLCADAKPTVLDAGFVFLGGDFAGVVPDHTINPSDGGPTLLRGFTNDPQVVKLYRRFLDVLDGDDDYRVGPVAIPAL